MKLLGHYQMLGVPTYQVGRLDEVDVANRHESVRLLISPDETSGRSLWIDSLLIPRRSETLLVVLHGALDRSRYQIPRFEFLSSMRSRTESLLFLADPSLRLDPDLTLAWYVGTSGDCLTDHLIEYVQRVAQQTGASNIVLFGSSGGGFAALALSHRLPGSLAVVFSPQTRVGGYYSGHVRRFVAACFPEMGTYAAVERSAQQRVDLRALYAAAPMKNFVWYVQNTGDPFHIDHHLAPFAQVLGLSGAGKTADGRCTVVETYLREGHIGPKPEQAQQALESAIAWRRSS